MSNSLLSKTANATKWSVITEVVAKLITPITNMILARILVPEAFGVLTTVLMVIAFAEVFVESGFQKYLIQHIFESGEQEDKYMSVAFWANLVFSFVIWAIIAAFNVQIADMVGNPGKGGLIVITGVTIPLYGMIGIQNCRLKKDLSFKKLFYVRIASSFAPLVITVPLALLGLDYWSLIIGNIAGITIRSVTLAAVKSFKPQWFFSWKYLKEMLSYGVWTILNGLAVWLTTWIDALIIGQMMTNYYLGLYKNSTNLITSVFSIVTASIVPVLFSSLSKLQNDEKEFQKMYSSVHKSLTMLLLPLGMGLLFYRSFATSILLGSQWIEAVDIIGITAITTVLRTLYVTINGDVFRAKGSFVIPLILQVLDLIISIPLCYWSLQKGFWPFVYVRSISKLILIIPELYFLNKICKISIVNQWINSWHYYFATAVMSVSAYFLSQFNGILISIVGIIFCVILYVAMLCLFKKERVEMKNMFTQIATKIKK